jgi:hypothetical protein
LNEEIVLREKIKEEPIVHTSQRNSKNFTKVAKDRDLTPDEINKIIFGSKK